MSRSWKKTIEITPYLPFIANAKCKSQSGGSNAKKAFYIYTRQTQLDYGI